ncbi:hypothetical protein SAY86_024547 [Trapa natans]|uniref:Multifunctional fusion protein n=1 Tax=Trapa natans TaxID=22666 RepID=A0AAN7M6U7_TRANT|nr:hypothetical protein SAY86_024547 [Trapa natans]
MSCCGGNCGCGSDCQCGNGCGGCKMYSEVGYSEETTTVETAVLGVAPGLGGSMGDGTRSGECAARTAPVIPAHVNEGYLSDRASLKRMFYAPTTCFSSMATQMAMVTKWQGLYDTTIRVLEDVRFVMNHAVVPKYILCSEQDSLLNWMDLLAFIQGMNPQKRETGPAEEEIENNHLPFVLCISIARAHSLLVEGAFSDAHFEETSDYWLNTSLNKSVDVDSLRYAKVGRFSQENSAHGSKVMITASDYRPKVPDNDSTSDFKLRIPAHVVWLIHECSRVTENWLLADNTLGAPSIMLSQSSSFVSTSNYSEIKRLLKTRTGRYISSRLKSSLEVEQSKTKDDDATMASEEGTNLGGKVKLMLTDEYHSFSGSIAISKSGSTGEYEHVPELERMHLLGLSEWPNITYDVSSQDISVHIPLHRLLSLLLRTTLKYSYGESTVPISQSPSTSSFDFFEQILGKFHPLGFSAFIMEHPLRIRVFVAEVHAGMWRKNGETALLSCEWYRSVQWSEQGLDLDLFMMQFCAALAPPDLYVRRILERFGLLNYLSPSPSRANEYEPILVQEMLTFLIQIVKERRFCGHSTAESLRRELIYKLTTGDFTRSQLVKSLPHDLAKFSRLQEVLDIVASYSNPSGHKQGKYSLRSPYWKELDLYHPHWNLRDLQLSEERYVRFCNESPLTAQLPRWTSIYEPMARVSGVATCRMTLEIIRAVLFHAVLNDKPSESRAPDTVLILALHFLSLSLDVCFQMRASNPISFNIGDSLPILALAIEVVDDGLACGFGEMSLLSVLVMLKKLHKRDGGSVLDVGSCDLSSLIESILKNFAELDSRCMAKLQKLAPELVNNVAQSPSNIHAASSRLLSDDEKRKAKARERQAAIMAKMRAEQSKFLACMDSSNKDLSSVQGISQPVAKGDSTLESAQDTCSLCHDSTSKSPLSFLIHLQKSKLASLVDKGPLSWERVEQPDKYHIPFVDSKEYDHCGMAPVASAPKEISNSRLGQFVQNAVSKFAYYGLPGEVNALLEFFKAQFPSLRNVHMPCISKEKKESTENKFLSLEENMFLSAMEFLHSNQQFIGSVEEINFSAKQDLQGELSNAENILFGKYIACLSQERAESPHASKNLFSEEAMEGSAVNQSSFDGFSPVDCDGIFLSSCGHVVHQECLDLYLSSLKERYIRRIVFEGGHIVDLDQGEFLCPVCRRLANSVLPAVPSASQLAWKQFLCSSLNFSQSPLIARSDITCLYIPQALCQLQSVAEMVKKGEIFKAFSFQSNAGLNTRLESFISVLSNMYFRRKQEKLLRSTRTNRSVIMWDTLRYSIISTEISARSGRTSLEPKVSLHALYEELISSGKFILPLFLEVIQSTRTENALDVLQRLRGIKLFADSICIGISSDYPNNPNEQQGNIFWILKDAEKEMSYVDTLFWKRSADPVLAHDAFSSLMWVLFCLPFPFLFSGESFLSLVHIFYAVSVAQIIVTYAGKYGFEQAELDSSSCLISAISKLMSESKCLGKCFISNYTDYSSNKLHKRDGGSLLDVGSCVLSSLIQSILKNFAELDSRCMTKLQKLAPELVNNVVQSPSNIHAASSRLVSDDEKCKAKAQERQAAIMGEFLCPLCGRLANSVLPAVPFASQLALKQFFCSSLNFSQSPLLSRSDITAFIFHRPCILQSVAEMVKKGEIFKAFSFQSNAGLNTKLESFISVMSNMYFQRKQEKILRSTRTRRSVIMRDTLGYSIISTEISARSGRTSLEPKVSLRALYEELISSEKFILPLFLEVIQSTRTENALDVLQRLRGIELFADSICIGVYSDYPKNPNDQ